MTRRSKTLAENKTQLAVVSAITALAAAASVLVGILGKPEPSSTDEARPSYISNDFVLENEDVNRATSPMLYDFMAGGVGTYDDLVSLRDGRPFVAIVTRDNSSKIYLSYNAGYGQGFSTNVLALLPSFCSEPRYHYLKSEDEMRGLHELLETSQVVSKRAVEGENHFYIIDFPRLQQDSAGRLGTLDINDLISKTQPGRLQRELENGHGYPTDIIRRCADVDNIKRVTHYDFDDPFWDRVNYGSYLKSYEMDGSGFVILTPIVKETVAGSGTYVNTFSVDGVAIWDTIESLDRHLADSRHQGVEDTISQKSYALDSEIARVRSIS